MSIIYTQNNAQNTALYTFNNITDAYKSFKNITNDYDAYDTLLKNSNNPNDLEKIKTIMIDYHIASKDNILNDLYKKIKQIEISLNTIKNDTRDSIIKNFNAIINIINQQDNISTGIKGIKTIIFKNESPCIEKLNPSNTDKSNIDKSNIDKLTAIYKFYIVNFFEKTFDKHDLENITLANYIRKFKISHQPTTCYYYKNLIDNYNDDFMKDEINNFKLNQNVENSHYYAAAKPFIEEKYHAANKPFFYNKNDPVARAKHDSAVEEKTIKIKELESELDKIKIEELKSKWNIINNKIKGGGKKSTRKRKQRKAKKSRSKKI
jgi:hypothetical protein